MRADGGFAHLPGLARPCSVDVRALPADAVATLEGLLDAAAPPGPTATRGADRRRYVIDVSAGRRRQTVTLTDPVEDPTLARLVEVLLSTARRAPR